MKMIGRGGYVADFLNDVTVFTRTIRIILACARGWEARVDNRFMEVLLAEAFAFMGNRCSRWVARVLVDRSTKYFWFPYLGAMLLEPNLEQHSRPIIVTMGFLRAVLPFAFSFQGSRIGRQLTYNTYKFANFRWNPVQTVDHFHEHAGVFQDTVLDPELEALARDVAVAIGHGYDPVAVRNNMKSLGYEMTGSGQGGYAVYRKCNNDAGNILTVHVTPYGPSILDDMPRYIVLERRAYAIMTGRRNAILDASVPPLATACGFTYSGAFFKSQEWAALKNRYDRTMSDYDAACRRLGTVASMKAGGAHSPPTDLATLKNFIRTGHTPKKHKKDKKRWKQLDAEIQKLSSLVAKYQRNGTAPKRVILYLEGLDCSAKSSTGGLISTALEGCGFAVRTVQHNRPPTAEQRARPWMDRGRFEYPEDVYTYGEEIPEYTALVWDRGPAGDFVYGNLSKLDEHEKQKKYTEFRYYDEGCQNLVLFCKLLFVTDKDSIAATLGKRLAHKKIARDLKTWLQANSYEHSLAGLEEIEKHIDPTDFVAFNRYWTNLSTFTDFVRNTDKFATRNMNGERASYKNPWTVVNTSDRHAARLHLLRTFENQLKNFSRSRKHYITKSLEMRISYLKDDVICHFFYGERHRQLSFRAVFQVILLVCLVYFYLYTTWKVDILKDVWADDI